MAIILQADVSHSYTLLKTRLDHYLNSDNISTEEQEKFGTLNKEYLQIQPRVLELISSAQVTPELQELFERLKVLSTTIFGIRQSNIEGWKFRAIEEGFETNDVNAVAKDVLVEYAQRWGVSIREE